MLTGVTVKVVLMNTPRATASYDFSQNWKKQNTTTTTKIITTTTTTAMCNLSTETFQQG
jgi:hypothetical protein